MKRQYSLCTEHLIVTREEDEGKCPQCKSDDHILTVVAAKDLKPEYKCSMPGHVATPQRPVVMMKTKHAGFVCSYINMAPANGIYDPMCGLQLCRTIPWEDQDPLDSEDEDKDE